MWLILTIPEVQKVSRATIVEDCTTFLARSETGGLLQPYVPQIQNGEWSLIFIDGNFTHAVQKVPVEGEFRINSQYGGRLLAKEPAAELIQGALKGLAILENKWAMPLYARVDGLLIDNEFCLLELELIEPSLYLTVVPDAVKKVAKHMDEFLSQRF